MTVGELAKALAAMPQDAECVVHHYENGYSPMSVVALEAVAADQDAGSSYTGPIAMPEEWESEDEDMAYWWTCTKRKPRSPVVRLDYRK